MRFQLCRANPQTLRASSPSPPPYERPARIRRTLIKFAHHDIDSIQTRNTSKIIRANQNRLIITVYHYHLQLNLREAHQQHQKWCHWQDVLQHMWQRFKLCRSCMLEVESDMRSLPIRSGFRHRHRSTVGQDEKDFDVLWGHPVCKHSEVMRTLQKMVLKESRRYIM